ncbi:COG1470 family protein [Amycolatopsis sp. w19]|uniref:COG1470 family protein n=1 Tax=Amycolatopsis sp. w19 TaxID=3448134 RepID=UPI003F1AD399
MGATATLSEAGLVAEPGQEISCSVTVRNAGRVVDQFAIEVVGDPGAWATAEPATVNLMPGEAGTVVVRFAPPRSSDVRAGVIPFGVRVFSSEDPAGSVVEEGSIQLGAFTEVTAEVVPAKVEAGSKADFEVAVDNRGNHPVAVELSALDPEDELDFQLERNRADLAPGTAAFVRLRARPRKRFLRGQPVRHRFQVFVVADDAEPLKTEGTMVQRQLLPKWLLPALAALLVLLLALVTLWFTVLRPAVKSAAREAAQEQNQEVIKAAQDAGGAAGEAKKDADQAKQNSEDAMKAVGLTPPPDGAPPGPRASNGVPNPAGNANGTPTDFRVAADAAVDSNVNRFAEFPYAVPDAAKTLVVTDLILQNPRGDNGTLRLLRDSGGTKTVLLEVGLANFRDLDHHWLQAWRFAPGEKIVLAVSCQTPGGGSRCTPSVSFSGRIE